MSRTDVASSGPLLLAIGAVEEAAEVVAEVTAKASPLPPLPAKPKQVKAKAPEP